jgi:hypothetical protein
MATKITHNLAIYNLSTHKVEGIESYTDEQKYRDRYYQFDLECQCRGKHLGWTVYDSTEDPFSWDAVTPKTATTDDTASTETTSEASANA